MSGGKKQKLKTQSVGERFVVGLYCRNQRHQMRRISKHVIFLVAADKCDLSEGNNRTKLKIENMQLSARH